MIIDSQLLFSDSQEVTATAGSTNTIDWGVSGGRDVGTGTPLYLVFVVEVAIDGSKTVAVALEGDSTTTFSPDATLTLFTTSAGAAAGTMHIVALDPKADVLQYRYNRLKYTASATLSTGTFTAFLTTEVDRWKAYANNITITE